jgi:hypothetical protein
MTSTHESTATVLNAGLTYFALAFGAGFVLGAIRVTFIVPSLGERWAELLEMPVMAVVIYFAARFVARKFALPPSAAIRWSVGAIALFFLLAAEVVLATLMQERTLAEYIASRDPVSGSVYLCMLLVFAAMPWWLARTRR